MIIDQLFTRPLFEEAAMASPEQLAYNRLRAQWDSYQTMTSGGGNTAVSRDPAHAAKLATIPTELARMAAALKAKGIDAEAQYDALSGPAAAPVDANQAYGLSENKSDPITQFASNAHEEWRRNFDPTGTKPRIKKNSDGTEGDINVPFEKLHPDWKKENLAAGHAAYHAVKHFGRDMEKAAEHVHNEWMKRNPKADYNAAQHVPYDDLSDDEKEKDRVHVRTMMRLMGHQLNEFAPSDDGEGPDQEEILRRLAAHWWNGNEHQMTRVEHTLAAMGWEIGEDDGYDEGGVFVVRAGDEHGRSYLSWPHEDLEMNEVAPPGARAERMVRHIKQGYARDGKLTPKEKGIAFATAWKAHNAGRVEEQGVAEGRQIDEVFADQGSGSTDRDNADYMKRRNAAKKAGYTGRETKAGTWRVFKDGNAVAAAGPFKSREEASAWIKKHKQGVTEMDKSLPSAGRDGGPRPGPDQAAKPISAKKATKDAADMLNRAVKDSHKKKDVKEGEIEQTKTGIRHRGDRYGNGEDLPNGGGNRSGFPNPGKYARDLDNLDKGLTSKLDHSMGVSWPKGRKKQDMDENINPLMLKLQRALIKEGRVKELADDLKTMSDADFMKKYGKAKAAIRRDMTKLDEAALTPDQAAKLAPYLQKDADGSQYYNLPTTNPGETGATMGQTNISPAALAQIKSPQGQQGIINQLLAMTLKQNAVPKTTTTATNVSKQYAGGLEEARSDYTPDEMADMLSGKRSQKQIDADAERTRGPNKAPPTKESTQSRAKRLNEKLTTGDPFAFPAAKSSSGKAIDDPDIMGSLKGASTPKFDRFSKTGGEPEFDFRTGLGDNETEIETDPRLAAEPNKYMQSWGGKFAVDTPDNRPAPGSAQWQYVINPDYKAEKEVQWIPSSEADSIASWKANNPGKSTDWGPASIPAASKSTAASGAPKTRWNVVTHEIEQFDPRTGTWSKMSDGSGANPNIDNATRDRARAWAAQQNAPGAALAGAMRSSGNPVDTAKKKTDWKTIYNLNKSIIGDNPSAIKPGMKLKMPDGSTYRVQPGDNLSKIAAGQINEQSALPPDQAARLAPYLQKGADGSQYYNLPTTNSGETGAVMGQTNISPAALAQIKSPEGQQGIINQLLAMTAKQNAVPKTTTTATNVSKQYAGGLEELSTNQLARYKTAAAADARAADQAGDFKRGDKRFHGIVQATKKQFDNDAKKVDESRAARRALMARIVNGG